MIRKYNKVILCEVKKKNIIKLPSKSKIISVKERKSEFGITDYFDNINLICEISDEKKNETIIIYMFYDNEYIEENNIKYIGTVQLSNYKYVHVYQQM